MQLIENKTPKKQRRIIVENPQLVVLFDLVNGFLSHATSGNNDTIIDVTFDEVAMELETVIGDIIDAIVDRIDGDELIKLIRNNKTDSLDADVLGIIKLLDHLAKVDRDGTLSILQSAAGMLLADVCKTIVDDLIQTGEFNNFKSIKVKTRRHVLVFC